MSNISKEDDRYVRMRAEDRSWWIKSSYFIEKYRLLWMAVVAILIAMGWQYVSPNERFHLLAQSQASMKASVDTVKQDVTDIKQVLRILVVIQCLDRTSKELAFLQLDCTKVQQYMNQTQSRP